MKSLFIQLEDSHEIARVRITGSQELVDLIELYVLEMGKRFFVKVTEEKLK